MALQGFMDFAGLSPQLDTLQLPKQSNLTLQKTSDSSFSQILSSFYKDDASFKKDESDKDSSYVDNSYFKNKGGDSYLFIFSSEQK